MAHRFRSALALAALVALVAAPALGASGPPKARMAGSKAVVARTAPIKIKATRGTGRSTWVGKSARAFSVAPASALFQVTYTGFTPAARAAFQAAVNYWAANVTSTVPIKVSAEFKALAGNTLGQAGPALIVRDGGGAMVPGTWYPIALGNKLAGRDLSTTNPDILASFDSDSPWYYGTGTVPANKYSFYSVVLHELGHGLGFLGSMNRNNANGQGTWGSSGFPFIWDRFARNAAGTSLITFTSPSVALGNQLISGDIRFVGTWTGTVRLYAPNPFQPGSSYSHLDEATYARGSANSLMTPQIAAGEGIGNAGPIVKSMFRDMGWGTGLACRAAHDITGDGANDLIARTTSGTLYVYPGNGTGGFLSRYSFGPGWTFYDDLLLTRDFSGDGCADIIGRRASDGALFLYKGTGFGSFLTAVQIGSGWSQFDTLLAPGDFSGDGRSDIIARKPDGTLRLYRGTGAGTFVGAPYPQIGTGWQAFTAIVAPGDFNGDGKSDLIARRANGRLFLYRGNGTGGFNNASYPQIGTGWGGFTALVAPGDWSGDGKSDILARNASGGLFLYRGTGTGTFAGGLHPQIGTGWQTFDIIR